MSTMERALGNKLLRRSFTDAWKPRVVDYFAVCGLGLDKRHVEMEGRFHVVKELPGNEHALIPFTPALLDRYPEDDHKRFELPRMLPSVVLPYGVRVYSEGPSLDVPDSLPKSFPVILTDTKGIKIFVAALRFRDKLDSFLTHTHKLPDDSYADKCICIVSHFPFLDTFLGLLHEIHRLCFLETGCPRPVWDLVADLARIPLPTSMGTVHRFRIFRDVYSISLPDERHSRPLNVSYRALVESLDIDSILKLFTSVLIERKILLKGSSVALLTDVAEAVVTLLYPLKWMPIYVPVLPVDALECLDAPVTFLYGAVSEDVDIQLQDLDKVVLVDLDRSTVEMVYAEGREPSEEEAKDYTQYGIPELPKKAAQRLRRSLTNLLRPHVSTLMTVPHSRSRQVWEDQDLVVGLSKECWGPRHDDRFQLAFIRFMAELLGGVRSFLTDPGSEEGLWKSRNLSEVFKGADFLAAKKREFGEEVEPLYSLLMVTYGWPGFVAEEAVEESTRMKLFEEAMNVLGTPEEALLELPTGPEDQVFIDLERVTFKPKAEAQTIAEADEDEDPGFDCEPEVHTRFPESEASIIAVARQKETIKRLKKINTIAMEEEKARKELLRLDYMARVHHHLDLLATDPANSESVGEIRRIIEACQAEEVLADCFIMCMDERFDGKEAKEIEEAYFNACKGLLAYALAIVEDVKDFETAAIFIEVAGKVTLKGSDSGPDGPTTLRRALKDLEIWHLTQLWEYIFHFRVDQWDKDSEQTPDAKMHVMMQLVKVMADVGLPLSEVGDIMETLCGTLSLKSQILLRDQFSQLQVLLNPQARKFVETLSMFDRKGSQRHRRLSSGELFPLSRSTERWMSAVMKVKSKEGLPPHPLNSAN